MAISAYLGAYANTQWGWPFAVVLIMGLVVGGLIAFLVSMAIGDAPCFSVVIVGLTFIFIVKTISAII